MQRTPILFARGKYSFQTIGIGNKRRTTSRATYKAPRIVNASIKSPHFAPGVVGSQKAEIGVQIRSPSITDEIAQMMDKPSMAYAATLYGLMKMKNRARVKLMLHLTRPRETE